MSSSRDSKSTSFVTGGVTALNIPGDVGIIEELFSASLDLIRSILSSRSSHRLTPEDQNALKRIQQMLFLWGENHNVTGGNLDTRLETWPRLMKVIVAILRSFLRCLCHGQSNSAKNIVFEFILKKYSRTVRG